MFKIFWSKDWFAMDIVRDRRTGSFLLNRFAARDFSGYPVPVFLIDQETLGL